MPIKIVSAVSASAMMTVIKRHKLEPINGEWHITKEMIAEAAAIDERQGQKPPSPEKLAAIVEGREPDWEVVDEEDLIDMSQTDDAYRSFLPKLRKLFIEEKPPHEVALRIATHMAVGLAVVELGWDPQTAKGYFSKVTEEFVEKLEASGRVATKQ
jgi:hypothetical protein